MRIGRIVAAIPLGEGEIDYQSVCLSFLIMVILFAQC